MAMAKRCRLQMNLEHRISRMPMPPRSTTTVLLMVLAVWTLQNVSAHRQPIVWSEVVLSEDQSEAQITHRLHRHDAIAWLRDAGERQPDLTKIKQRAEIALHAANTTRFWRKDKSPAAVAVIGAEVQDNFLFVYLQVEETQSPITHVHTSLLAAFNPSQSNRVNVTTSEYQESFEFSAQSPPAAIKAAFQQ